MRIEDIQAVLEGLSQITDEGLERIIAYEGELAFDGCIITSMGVP